MTKPKTELGTLEPKILYHKRNINMKNLSSFKYKYSNIYIYKMKSNMYWVIINKIYLFKLWIIKVDLLNVLIVL